MSRATLDIVVMIEPDGDDDHGDMTSWTYEIPIELAERCSLDEILEAAKQAAIKRGDIS